MSGSPERRAAEQQVEEAIAALRAVTDPDSNALPVAWTLVTAHVTYDGPNDDASSSDTSSELRVYMPDGAPTYQTLGLLRSGQVLCEVDWMSE